MNPLATRIRGFICSIMPLSIASVVGHFTDHEDSHRHPLGRHTTLHPRSAGGPRSGDCRVDLGGILAM